MARLRALAQYQGMEEQERLEEGMLAEHRLRARIQVGTMSRAGCVHACGLAGGSMTSDPACCRHCTRVCALEL